MIYGSVCSGIEAATAAWHPLGWRPAWFCEIEAFPSAVLAHHHPQVNNYGDFTQLLDPAHPARHGAPLDLLVGGTPCQSFSHAGGRAGLDDPRGQLMLRYLDLVGALRPRWIVWENVPGVLSSGGGRDFGSLLGGLADLGYGVAYRVLDARYFGVPQRRRRVFVVGHSGGDPERAARVLALDEGVRGHSAARGGSRKEAAAATRGGAAVGGKQVTTFMATMGGNHGSGYSDGTTPGLRGVGSKTPIAVAINCVGFQSTLGSHGGNAYLDESITLKATGGTNGNVAAVAVTPFDTTQITCPTNGSQPRAGDTGHPLSATAHPPAIAWCPDVSGPLGGASRSGGFRTTDLDNNGAYIVSCLTPWDTQQRRVFDAAAGVFPSLDACANTTGGHRGPPSLLIADQRGHDGHGVAPTLRAKATSNDFTPMLLRDTVVRRLTPRECERLQGFSDDHTLIPYKGKPATDGHRYKALGNSMAVPVMRWIGERIQQEDARE